MKTVTVRIKNLRLRTYIGFNPEETEKKQDVVINVLFRYLAPEGIRDDNIDAAVNYKTITKKVIRFVESNNFLLLEKLTQDVLDLVLACEGVSSAQVQIDKPHALRFADSVSVEMEGEGQGIS